MSGREICINSSSPREEAIKFVTNDYKYRLKVDSFIDAGRPSGLDSHVAPVTRSFQLDPKTSEYKCTYETTKKGIKGTVFETGQSFTIRDDFDFANPTSTGKGYHVNVQLGTETRAYCSGRYSENDYYDRTNMTGERYFIDGKDDAAAWYTSNYSIKQ
ncbi:hypothetical protein LOZ51_000109 [Ophidiomyces ophidiicola]|nr:hypothetical protein LOZ55_002735 [Ophidiomyces ophidiicola]KAI1994204.1 hypothetical protein LOZ54_001048 [Ophidiomyces ophidiicola]KAI2003036.1 hypothetical protein LOZ51_000109 [Ophidiomyces ophidiicola]